MADILGLPGHLLFGRTSGGDFVPVQVDIDGVVQTSGGGGGGTPGGNDTEVQYNNAGAFGGISGATTDGTTLTLVAPILGTPASVTLTNGIGLPISTGVSGLGAGVATFLATPSSANLASALTTKTGTGLAVFDTAPTLPTTVTIGAAGGTTGQVLLKGTTSGTVTLSVADAAGTYTLKLPTSDGSSGQALITNGSGQLSFSTVGGGITIGTTTITSGTSGRVLYNNAGVVGEMTTTGTGTELALSTGPTLVAPVSITGVVGQKALTLGGATQTTSQPLIDATQTWNAGGVTFTALKLNVTDTSSVATSLFADFQVGGTSVVTLDKTGRFTTTKNGGTGGYMITVSGQTPVGIGRNSSVGGINIYGGSATPSDTNALVAITGTAGNANASIVMDSAMGIGWASTNVTQAQDVVLRRDAANTLGQRNGTNAQRLNIANTFTSLSNREDLSLYFSSNVAHIGTTTTGATARVFSIDYGGTTTSAISIPITSGDITLGGALKVTSATMIKTATTFTNGAGASTGTLTNAPSVGDPSKWIPIDDNGTTRYIPAWT